MENYDNLVDAISALRKQGYVEDFNLKPTWLECRNGEYTVLTDEFEIDKSFRFEADSSADDSSILYAISAPKYNLKGILVNSYSIYSDEIADELLDKLKPKY